MIRMERLSLATESFAAERKEILNRTEAALTEAVRNGLRRKGTSGWLEPIMRSALDIFDQVVLEESDGQSQVISDLRTEFERQVRESMNKVKAGKNPEAQVQSITRWLSTMTVNSATEAATSADPDEAVGLEWITMGDGDVRETHRDANGQTVPSGQPFTVGGVEFLYPGEPKGDPSLWMNCRCVARPTRLDGFAGKTVTAAGEAPGLKKDGSAPKCEYCRESSTGFVMHSEGMAYTPACDAHMEQAKIDAARTTPNGKPDESNIDKIGSYGLDDSRNSGTQEKTIEEKKQTSTVIVALPAAGDPITAISSEEDGAHCTLAYLGDSSGVDGEAMKVAIQEFIDRGGVTPVADAINGVATLGKDEADVALLDAKNLVHIKNGLVQEQDAIAEAWGAVEQFPSWIAHVTLGYPDTPRNEGELPETVTFDRLALWHGEEKIEFPLGEAMPDSEEAPIVAAAEVDEEVVPDPEEEEAEMVPEEDETAEVPWHGVLAPEGVPSGDGRQFALDGLTHRSLPLPLKAMFLDDSEHKGSGIVGRIDRIFREDGLIKASGVFDTSATANEAIRLIAEKMWRGVSVDVDAVEAGVVDEENQFVEFSAARIASATLCAIPAFAEAFVALGPWPEEQGGEEVAEDAETPETDAAPVGEFGLGAHGLEEFDIAPTKTKDGPGWITDPKPTQRITGYWVDGIGAAKIGWGAPGDFNRCRVQLGRYVRNPEHLAGLCANLHYRALGAWPGQASAGTEAMTASATLDGEGVPSVNVLTAGGGTLSADYFRDPEFTGPASLTIDGQHVFGHLATWDTCHIGVGNACVNAPHSATGYANYATGKVLTDAGPIPVGQITMGGGHASLNKGLRAAVSHYDTTSTAVADVAVGEDAYGIWVSGKIRDGVTEEEVFALRAAGVISGDWREVVVGGESNLELVAALAVNVPGFPIPRPALAASGGSQTALIAASIPMSGKTLVEAESEADKLARVDRIKQARAQMRSFTLDRARELMKG